MAAATNDRDYRRSPGDLVPYTGASGYKYYKGAMLMRDGAGGIRPLTLTGGSNGYFLGIIANRVDLTAGLGASNQIIEVYKEGVVTLEANGTGASAHIGLRAYAIDDQTVGTSAAAPAIPVGEIVGLQTTAKYRVRIQPSIGINERGVSWATVQNPA